MFFFTVISQDIYNTNIFDRQRSKDTVVQLIVSFDFISVCRAGLSKCRARLEAFLRGPTQWLVQKRFRRESSHNHRNHELW